MIPSWQKRPTCEGWWVVREDCVLVWYSADAITFGTFPVKWYFGPIPDPPKPLKVWANVYESETRIHPTREKAVAEARRADVGPIRTAVCLVEADA